MIRGISNPWVAGDQLLAADLNDTIQGVSTLDFEAGENLALNDTVYIKTVPVGLNHGTAVSVANQYSAISVSVNATTNANRLLLAKVVSINSQPLGSIAATYNGVSMTLMDTRSVGANYVYIFGLVAPASGSNTFACSWTGGFQGAAEIVPYYGAAQSLPSVVAYATGTGTALSNTISTTAANDWVVTFSTHQSGAVTSGTNNTILVSTTNCGGVGDSGALASTGSKSITATAASNMSNPWSMYSLVIPQFRQAYDAVFKASASAAGTVNATMGFSSAAYTTGQTAKIITSGTVTGLSGLVTGTQYYVSNTAGLISSTAGTVTRKIGIAISSTILFITNIW